MKSNYISFLFLLFASSLGFTQTVADTRFAKNIVTVNSGKIQGITDVNSGIRNFFGVPYAQPPVGDLRWKEPQPTKPWDGVKKTTKFAARCMQKPVFSDMNFRSTGRSEDCLYLNIWSPAEAPDENLPVLVYLYGGGFIAGDGSEWRYDGTALAQKGIVVVTVNYRLGIFGFLAHPELTQESPHRSSGNYGFLDQAFALQWVHDNIAAFGGNPEQITIGGESAGSMSVSALMASPLSKNLLAGAIGESGALAYSHLKPIALQRAEKRGVSFARKNNFSSLKELREVPADRLLQITKKGLDYFAPTLDGYFFPHKPSTIYAAGKQAQIPLLVGWNSAEASYSAFLKKKEPLPANYYKVLKSKYKSKADAVFKIFPGNSVEEVKQSATALASADFITYNTWKWSEYQRQSGNKTYRYIFDLSRPFPYNDDEVKREQGAGHSWEIEYALGNLRTNKVYPWTAIDYRVSAYMQDYFANFIKTGNPNGPDLPQWRPNIGTPEETVQVMKIGREIELQPEQNREQMVFFESLQ